VGLSSYNFLSEAVRNAAPNVYRCKATERFGEKKRKKVLEPFFLFDV
jgi:hypothetical protein